MTKIVKLIFIFSVFISLFSISCKPGIGGKSKIQGTCYHHTKPIPFTKVYIKYGATEFPGTDVTAYDDHTTADTNAFYQFTNLRMGNYFLYGVGFDYAIALPVTGGIPVKVKYDKTENTNLPITE